MELSGIWGGLDPDLVLDLCGLDLSPGGKVSLLSVFSLTSSAAAAAKLGVLHRTGGWFLDVLVNFIAQPAT